MNIILERITKILNEIDAIFLDNYGKNKLQEEQMKNLVEIEHKIRELKTEISEA
jgi:bifunctional ADP-heptose synthase (sugar kinase/adenylyltransferase)